MDIDEKDVETANENNTASCPGRLLENMGLKRVCVGVGAEAKQKRKDDFGKKKTEKAATQMNSKEGNTVS